MIVPFHKTSEGRTVYYLIYIISYIYTNLYVKDIISVNADDLYKILCVLYYIMSKNDFQLLVMSKNIKKKYQILERVKNSSFFTLHIFLFYSFCLNDKLRTAIHPILDSRERSVLLSQVRHCV